MKETYDWFEPLYARAAGDVSQVPWALPGAVPYLTQWLSQRKQTQRKQTQRKQNGEGLSAVVVGCGLGDDAEALAAAGFAVTAFDVAQSAISWAKKRFPESSVNYVAADLFDLPDAWIGAFDVVFEFRTIQALPISVRREAIASVASLPKPGGRLLLATYTRDSEEIPDGPPWPLSATELAWFEEIGLKVVKKEVFKKKESRFSDRVQIEYQVPDSGIERAL